MSRRQFLGSAVRTASLAAPLIVPATALGRAGRIAPGERIAMGCIGVGTMGFGDMNAFLSIPEVQVVAVCDVKRAMRERAKQAVDAHYGSPSCATCNDFRELLARDDIDAVCIATLDSWHVLHALAAVRAGKDVYLEKPLGMGLHEIRVLRDAVHRYGRVFQFGTQQRSSQEFRHACEIARNGRLGKVHAIQVGVHAGANERSGLRTYAAEPVPEGLDYDLWLGPAPWAPYTTARLTYPHWFHISDYSLGYVSGWGIHHIDIAQWGNGTELTGPVEVEGSARFPADDALCDNPVGWETRMHYANGVELVFTGEGPGVAGVRQGITFRGPDGWVWVNRGAIEAEPASLLKERFGPEEVHLPVSTFHQANFIECVRSRQPTIANIDVAVRSDTVCQLAWCAFQLQRRLRWDPEAEVFVGDADANRRMTRPLRPPGGCSGWRVPGPIRAGARARRWLGGRLIGSHPGGPSFTGRRRPVKEAPMNGRLTASPQRSRWGLRKLRARGMRADGPWRPGSPHPGTAACGDAARHRRPRAGHEWRRGAAAWPAPSASHCYSWRERRMAPAPRSRQTRPTSPGRDHKRRRRTAAPSASRSLSAWASAAGPSGPKQAPPLVTATASTTSGRAGTAADSAALGVAGGPRGVAGSPWPPRRRRPSAPGA